VKEGNIPIHSNLNIPQLDQIKLVAY